MWKAALAGTAALAIVGSSLVYAQERGRPDRFERFQPNVEDMRAFADARLAALHAGLGLNTEQEKNWPAFEQATREMTKLRLDRFSAGVQDRRDRAPRSDDPSQRMHQRAAAMTATGAALQKVADAFDPLYKSLDDTQKRRFAMLQQFMRGDGGRGRELRDRDGRDSRDFRDRDERGRDGRDRRFDGGPRRTDYVPQAHHEGEEQL